METHLCQQGLPPSRRCGLLPVEGSRGPTCHGADFKVHGAVTVRRGSGRGGDARGGLGNADSLNKVPGPVLSPPEDRGGQGSPLLGKAASQPGRLGEGREEGGRREGEGDLPCWPNSLCLHLRGS